MMAVFLPIDANAGVGTELAQAIRAAAGGDIEIQRTMRDDCIVTMRTRVAEQLFAEAHVHAVEAMFWARLVASRGTDDDAIILSAALAYVAEYWGGEKIGCELGNLMASEALSIIDRVASNGHERAAATINDIASAFPVHIIQQAKQISEIANGDGI